MDYREEAPPLLNEYMDWQARYGLYPKTIKAYYVELRGFFRWVLRSRRLVSPDVPFDQISIRNVNLPLVRSIQDRDVYEWLDWIEQGRGLPQPSRSRKVSAIRGFYGWLSEKGYLDSNPMATLAGIPKTLPVSLTDEEVQSLLKTVKGLMAGRDTCILLLLLNYGLRADEVVDLNVSDLHGWTLTVRKTGRELDLNPACQEAMAEWLDARRALPIQPALFVTLQGDRICSPFVHTLVKKYLHQAGLDQYTVGSLRRTAAESLLRGGMDRASARKYLGYIAEPTGPASA